MDTDDLELFTRSLRHAADPAPDGPTLDVALVELGWHDALDDFPRPAIGALFSIQGETATTSSALPRVLSWALTGSTTSPGSVLPPLATATPPGSIPAGSAPEDATATVDGMANTALLSASDTVTVPIARPDGTVGALVVSVADLVPRPVTGLDPEAALVQVSGSVDAAETSAGEGSWDQAVRLGRIAVAHELVGASRAILAQAREHALERIQFGQPISRFQAVRHKLAEILIAIETAEALIDAAWLDETAVTAAMAKASAGRAGRVAARHGQQVLAGIGFTTEHGLHRWVRRILVLDETLGSTRTLTAELGEDLLARGTLPPLLPL